MNPVNFFFFGIDVNLVKTHQNRKKKLWVSVLVWPTEDLERAFFWEIEKQQPEVNDDRTLQYRKRWKKSRFQNGCYRYISPWFNKTTNNRRCPDRENTKPTAHEFKKRVEYAKYAAMRRAKIEWAISVQHNQLEDRRNCWNSSYVCVKCMSYVYMLSFKIQTQCWKRK